MSRTYLHGPRFVRVLRFDCCVDPDETTRVIWMYTVYNSVIDLCSKAVIPVLVLLFVALWFILRGDLLYVLPFVILFLCFSVL